MSILGIHLGAIMHTGSYEKASEGIYFATVGVIVLATSLSIVRKA